MSQTQKPRTEDDLVKELREFITSYYPERVGELAQSYNSNKANTLTIEWRDMLMALSSDENGNHPADDYLNAPTKMDELLTRAVNRIEVPNVKLQGVDVRVVGLNDEDIYKPIEIDRDQPRGYLGVQGQLKKATEPNQEIQESAYECLLCGTMNYVPQIGESAEEPRECVGCERQGRFKLDHDQSTFEHYCKVRIETPPDESGELQSDHIDGYIRGDLVWSGSDEFGIITQTGKSITAYGTVGMKQKTGRGVNERLFDTHLLVEAIEFDTDEDEVDIEKHKDEFTELAQREDAVDIFAESLVPELHSTPEWNSALPLLVGYLFAAPRIDIPDGPTYRGDIHVLIMSDYGMGKSMVNSSIAMYSPKCIKESVTGMSSDVGLLAAAVEDDFGEGQWTLQPGILVRANGGHVILDEIDKTDANLERMNDALEGEQMVQVNKAGQRASYKSRMGLLATGNPKDSRFDSTVPISEQMGLDESLLSRFDGIVTMEDSPDEEQDGMVANAQGMSYVEAQEYQYGDREEFDRLSRVVSPDVGRSWIAYAREEINPLIKAEHIKEIENWYSNELRQLNHDFARNQGVGQDMPVPVNARVVANTIRLSVAFARVGLQETVTQQNVERAKKLVKNLVGQTFEDGQFTPRENKQSAKPKTQHEKINAVREALDMNQAITPAEIADKSGLDEKTARQLADKLCDKNPAQAMKPTEGVYRGV